MKELLQLLENHDWFYQYADDYRKWQRGSNQRAAILTLVGQLGPEAEKLFTKYHKEKFPSVYE